MSTFNINMSEYDYALPDAQIAYEPAEPRDASRLLIVKDNVVSESIFSNIANHLPSNSLLVWNNTRVIHARLIFFKESGARIEVFCLEPVSPEREVQRALQAGPACVWKCMVGNARKWKDNLLLMNIEVGGNSCTLTAERIGEEDGQFLIRFNWSPEDHCMAEILEAAGKVPLPPYIDREATEVDNIRYQTVYAQHDGSVAAPTAGLHFTHSIIEALHQKNISNANVTLHVGAGTFKPVSEENVSNHIMHNEQIHLRRVDLERLIEAGERVIAVGTTSLRTLESFYWQGVKLHSGQDLSMPFLLKQWEPYDGSLPQDIAAIDAWKALMKYMDHEGLDELRGETRLFIVPGYRIRTTQLLITNFHQPRSTLLLLVAAFAGEVWREAYDFALKNNFRFLSYGDACLFYLYPYKP